MNRFYLEETPRAIAESHCDKHIVKMPLEEAQMLCTAHRLLDGTLEKRPSKSGKTMVKYWKLDDMINESLLYKAVHTGHPCTIWAMESDSNYRFAYSLFIELCREYSYRYGKTHMCEKKLWIALRNSPKNISKGPMTPMPMAMGSNPECINPEDVIGSYRHYYATKKDRFKMIWTNRNEPKWWNEYVQMVG